MNFIIAAVAFIVLGYYLLVLAIMINDHCIAWQYRNRSRVSVEPLPFPYNVIVYDHLLLNLFPLFAILKFAYWVFGAMNVFDNIASWLLSKFCTKQQYILWKSIQFRRV